jgi:hypothetical protein
MLRLLLSLVVGAAIFALVGWQLDWFTGSDQPGTGTPGGDEPEAEVVVDVGDWLYPP